MKIPKAVKRPYSGFVKVIIVSPTKITIGRMYRSNDNSHSPDFGLEYKSDLITFEFFKKLVRDKDMVWELKDGIKYKCLHSLWKDVIIVFDT